MPYSWIIAIMVFTSIASVGGVTTGSRCVNFQCVCMIVHMHKSAFFSVGSDEQEQH